MSDLYDDNHGEEVERSWQDEAAKRKNPSDYLVHDDSTEPITIAKHQFSVTNETDDDTLGSFTIIETIREGGNKSSWSFDDWDYGPDEHLWELLGIAIDDYDALVDLCIDLISKE